MSSSHDTEKSVLDTASERPENNVAGAPVEDSALEAVSGGAGLSPQAFVKETSGQSALADNELAGIPVKRQWV